MQNLSQRRSHRLNGYDYQQGGAYYVTICTHNRDYLLGEITDCVMQLSPLGEIAMERWLWLAEQYPYVDLDTWVVMPNHLHGIVIITDETGGSQTGGSRTAPTNRKTLGRLIGAFKTTSTKAINLEQGTPGEIVWQRDYYDHIIRNEVALNKIREYIINNPLPIEADVHRKL